mgnify:CR=1 FL=1
MKSNKDECLFCRVNPNHLVAEDEFCYAAKDSFPVTEFHMLIIPKRHVAAYFDLNLSEVTAMHDMLVEMKKAIETKDNSVTGFNSHRRFGFVQCIASDALRFLITRF